MAKIHLLDRNNEEQAFDCEIISKTRETITVKNIRGLEIEIPWQRIIKIEYNNVEVKVKP